MLEERLGKQLKLVLLGLGVGCGAGLIVSAFRWLIGYVFTSVLVIYEKVSQDNYLLGFWIIFSLIMAWILSVLTMTDKDIKGSGIPQVELQIQGKLAMNWWSVLWKKFLVGSIAIGSGLMLGREGPSIQLGSTIGLGIAEQFNFDDKTKNALIASGASSGVAAAFNAPLAGLMFSIEELYHRIGHELVLMILTASLTAHLISATLFGHQPALGIPNLAPFPTRYYPFVICLGIILAGGGFLYSKVTLSLPRLFNTYFPFVSPHFYGIIPMLLIIPLGIVAPYLLGGGGPLIVYLLEQQYSLTLLCLFFVVRFMFSMLSYGSGLPGGIFLPILSLGAIQGMIVGNIASVFIGLPTEFLPYIVMFSMAGYFAAISKAPFTAILLVTEMVGGLSQLVPIAICVMSAYIMASLLGVQPIYELLAERLIEQSEKQTVEIG